MLVCKGCVVLWSKPSKDLFNVSVARIHFQGAIHGPACCFP